MQKALIIFPFEWIPISPTTLNIVEMLQQKGLNVSVVMVWDEMYPSAIGLPCEVIVIKIPLWVRRFFRQCRLYGFIKFFVFCRVLLSKKKADFVFAVDALGYVIAKVFYKNPVFVSLEIWNDTWTFIARFLKIKTLLIQSKERASYLFPKKMPEQVLLLPNSPIVSTRKFELKKQTLTGKLVYCGGIYRRHGVELCIDALNALSQEITLTLKGIMTEDYYQFLTIKYAKLMRNKRLMIDRDYTKQSDITSYLSQFDIGLCFYDIDAVKGDFNYITCPSGKMYTYFASGLPVIGSNIWGLHDVVNFKAGILLDVDSQDSMKSSIEKILRNYSCFSNGALKAAVHFNFAEHFDRVFEIIKISSFADKNPMSTT